MHYDPIKNDHGLTYDPFKSCVVPRPIGWISTCSATGIDNLAPYSQFQNLTFDPPMVMFSSNQTPEGNRKDSVVNAEATGEFVWNMATYDLRNAVNQSAKYVDPSIDEFEIAGLEKAASIKVSPPRVAKSPIQFECEHIQTIRIPGNGPMGTVDLVLGKVVLIHIDDQFINGEGKVDIPAIKPIARLGYYDYTVIEKTFEMIIPGNDAGILQGLEGRQSQSKNNFDT